MTIACFSRKRNGHVLCFKMKTHYHLGQVSAKKKPHDHFKYFNSRSHDHIIPVSASNYMAIFVRFQHKNEWPFQSKFQWEVT